MSCCSTAGRSRCRSTDSAICAKSRDCSRAVLFASISSHLNSARARFRMHAAQGDLPNIGAHGGSRLTSRACVGRAGHARPHMSSRKGICIANICSEYRSSFENRLFRLLTT